jgi:hypothetical protein
MDSITCKHRKGPITAADPNSPWIKSWSSIEKRRHASLV